MTGVWRTTGHIGSLTWYRYGGNHTVVSRKKKTHPHKISYCEAPMYINLRDLILADGNLTYNALTTDGEETD